MNRDDIRLEIQNIKELPTLPGVAREVLSVANEEGSSARELAAIILHDQSLSSKVLNLANSAFYGFSMRIATINQAVVVLGFSTVKSLALGVAVYNGLSRKVDRINFDREQFWIHSIGCAVAARLVAKDTGMKDTGIPFVVGLLHDMGKVFLDTYFNVKYREVIEEMIEEGRSATEVEDRRLKTNHAEVGGWLAKWWKFPEILVVPISRHHNLPERNSEHYSVAAMVHVANILTKTCGIGLNYEVDNPKPESAALQTLNITPQKLLAISSELNREKKSIQDFFRDLSI